MFRKLKETLDAALSALEGRSSRSTEEDLHRLLAAMRDELIETKASLPELEDHIRKLTAARARELEEADVCARRARQAEKIGDSETVEVARRFEARHRTQAGVYDQKVEAAEAELAMQRQTVVDMTAQLKSAVAQRDALAARSRRAGATEKVRGSRYSSVDTFDRLADAIEREEDVAAAQRDVDLGLEEDQGSATGSGSAPAMDSEDLAELQLRELKRRMAAEGDRKKR